MTIQFEYYVRFGPGDCSDTLDWEIDLTPEEEARLKAALASDEDLDAVMSDVVDRAYAEIEETEKANMEELDVEDWEEEWDVGWSLVVTPLWPEPQDDD